MGTSIKDQTNPAFEAIARREAFELHLQQMNNNKRLSDKNRVDQGSASLKRTNQQISSSTNAANTPSKKGKYSFTGQTSTRDTEADHPIYLPLSHPVHEKLAMPNPEVNVVDKILHELLQSGDSAQNYVQGSRRMKIDNLVHLDNKVQKRNMSGMALADALRSHSKRSKKHMSMKQHKKHGSLDFPLELHNFEKFKPMHEMWKGYIMQLLKNAGKSQMAQCLLSADLHGAHILVADCRMADFKGVSGIMIRETAETFGIITKDNKFKVVLKKISVFMLQVDCWKITLYGDKLTSRKVGQ
uniref:ribonuclease P protein subunit p29 n=1 Tax=Erigeron canadensis TaxID=72917 RepID=UPI001CB938D5|nr:ribonuclease P protein subunit p29 [Erigeron canadensis]XP_043631701.1 ribonuclease P protein subunit p29 [Erigeron canadensis]XP_043631702.1 ribonuclease P protein subunit p29 [Erigeron canadensis]XP_043631703.1 ribonuclease P protein subunit p29 [Erigeron canadensis]